MHALPGIVDGARKTSQGGSWRRVDAALPILEATTSREQYMSAVSSTVQYRASDRFKAVLSISIFNPEVGIRLP